MKLLVLTVSIGLLFGASVAWEVDERCVHRRVLTRDQVKRKDGLRQLRGTTEQRELQSSFQLKMFWQQGFCWQEEWIERKWCMSCQGKTCESGEPLRLEFCNSTAVNQKFEFISETDQLKTASSNLCLERISDEVILLTECTTIDGDNQIFRGVQTDGSAFQLNPRGDRNACLTNDFHHPKAQEVIHITSCSHAQYFGTDAWTAFSGNDSSNPETASELTTIRDRESMECSSSRPCNTCEGDCDSDEDCSGNLRCFQRDGAERVPGCFGPGSTASDYCFQDSTNAPTQAPVASNSPVTATPTLANSPVVATPTVANSPVVATPTVANSPVQRLGALVSILGECSEEKPCGMCEGDCDNDDQCAGDLVCYQKNGTGSVTGCSGISYSRTDFCGFPL